MATDILTSNFFELFNVPVAFDVDLELIQQRYRELQNQVHPDHYVNASAQEKRISMQQTSRINEALNTLKHPVERAIYLLKLKNIDINLQTETTMDEGFLIDQMEMREQLAEATSKEDPLAELDSISKNVKEKINAILNSFSDAYEDEQLNDAKEWVRKMQFMQKVKNEVDQRIAAVEDELF